MHIGLHIFQVELSSLQADIEQIKLHDLILFLRVVNQAHLVNFSSGGRGINISLSRCTIFFLLFFFSEQRISQPAAAGVTHPTCPVYRASRFNSVV